MIARYQTSKISPWCFWANSEILFQAPLALMCPSLRLYSVVYQKIGIIIAQTTIQNGHKEPILKRLWYWSQNTKAIPKLTPIWRPSQNQRLNLAPAKRPAPIVVITPNPKSPKKGFGKPKAEAWAVLMTDPQAIIGFRSQLKLVLGFWSSDIFSYVSIPAQNAPIIPPISKT